MSIIDVMKDRHSVRSYKDTPIEGEVLSELMSEIEKCNAEGDLNIRLINNEPRAFDGFMAHYGKFSGVKNYVALIGKRSKGLSEKCGYYGERIVIKAQELGLNTCWVAMTYKKIPEVLDVAKDEKLTVVIAIGYGNSGGTPHKSKMPNAVSNVSSETPNWFSEGVEAALLAPTAMNQQKFYLTYDNDKVFAKSGIGFYTKIDLGIVKYHFEAATGKSVE